MNAIPGLPLAASALFVLLAVLALVGLPESRQRSAYWKLALLAAAWALLSALFWQQVPALQQIWFAALLLLAWGGWRLIAAVCQVELRRRWLLWLGRMLLGGVLLWLLLLQPAVLSPLEGPMQWQDGLPLRLLSGVLLGLIALSFGEWLLAVLVQQERAHVAPWVFVWLLLSWGLVLDLLAGTSLFAGEVPPLGALPVALALVLGLWLNHRRSGPFPLHGELPRAAFAQTTDPVLLVDGAQRIQAASPAALDVLGRSAALVIGRRLQAVLPEVPAESSAWDGPLWLQDPSRPDGGLWLQAADMQGDRRGAVARLLHVRSGLVWPAPLPLNAGPQRAASRWIHGPSVRPALESVLRRYGLGRQGLAAALHVDYDWARVQQEHGESLLEPLLQGIAERLQQVCDWPVDCFRLPQGQFLLLLTDLTGGEELQTLVQRAESLCAEPFNVGGRRWTLRLRLAAAPDLRLYRTVDEWLADADAALVESRGQCVSTRPQAERRGRLILALEQALLHDGLDWEFEPVLNLTTQQISAWRVHPRWDPEPDVSWRGPRLREAVAHLHMQKSLYAQAGQQAMPQKLQRWLPVWVEDLSAARKGLAGALSQSLLELDRVSTEALRQQGLRAVAGEGHYLLPVAAGEGFGFGLRPEVLALDAALVIPGIADDLARQALIRGCKGAARAREQRLFARGVAAHADLQMLRELGVDYACGPAVGPLLDRAAAERFVYRPLRA